MKNCYIFKAKNIYNETLIGSRCCKTPGWLQLPNGLYTPADDNIALIPEWVGYIGTITPCEKKGDLQFFLTRYTVNHKDYFLSNQGTWEQIQTLANYLNGNLVTIESAEKQSFLENFFGVNEPFWIGFSDRRQNGTFEWISGKPVTYTNWANTEPNDFGSIENYVYMNGDLNQPGKWFDSQSNARFRGIIESLVEIRDFDCQDCLKTGTYVFLGTDNQNQKVLFSACCDNPTWLLSRTNSNYYEPGNSDQYLLNVDQGWQTIDRDILLVNNNFEFFRLIEDRKVYSNLVNPFFVFNNYIHFLSSADVWINLYDYAQSIGGNLVTIESAEKQKFLEDSFGTSEIFWIGLNDENSEGSFKWMSGKPVTYTNWNSGEPNNFNNEDYVSINYLNPGKWSDFTNINSFRGIIEIKLNLDFFGITKCLDYDLFPNIKANRIDIKLPDYQNYSQIYENTDVFVKRSQFVGANADITLSYEFVNADIKKELEMFYKFSKNKGFKIPFEILRSSPAINDLMENWQTFVFMFKQEIVITPKIINKTNQLYDVQIFLISCVN